LPLSTALASTKVCPVNLDIEMETGTGKTYCYIKTMFELYQRYGWSKFIVVVPSIAIREGVKKSFKITAEHFLEEYGKQARVFIYNSKSLHEIESFSSDASINVMIINVQAFNATGKDARRIYEELDDFQSRKPIDVIQANRPILILDEPQKMEGKKTVESLVKFNPLMILRYSATHKTEHNKIHRLDALDAYNQKLVKKIAVRGISVKGLSGTNAYLYVGGIQVSTSKPPIAKVELEIKQTSGIKRVHRNLGRNDNLFDLSGGLDQYKGFVISDIDALKDTVSFTNGVELQAGEATGDVNEMALRRIQIREAIRAHFEKEQMLFRQGIKVLSLFFIDEVAKYRQYDENGEQPGEYAQIFEEEYQAQLQEVLTLFGDEYDRYLKGIPVGKTHNGYFSIDKKTSRLVDPTFKTRGETPGETDDVDAYDLILKDKERLLSFEEPVRFIFSHSALREGWDNPNVFVICTLKHSDNTISRRQEVGRGMRLSVNQGGERMDDPATVHQTNVLTVVASESYKDFVSALQKDISESLSARPRVANEEYFAGKVLKTPTGDIPVNPRLAKQIYRYLVKNDYTDDNDKIAQAYHEAKKEEQLALLPVEVVVPKTQDQGQHLVDTGELVPAADSSLAQKALRDGATQEDIDKGTEFLFYNDDLSNGKWDNGEEGVAATEIDDDAQEIVIKPGITEGEVWLEHPAIDKLSFYKDSRECKDADKITLTSSARRTVSSSNPFPDVIFVRADRNDTFPADNPQFEGDLVLKINVGEQEIEAEKIKLNIVRELGAQKYFHAVRDYIFENNTKALFRDLELNSGQKFRLGLMAEDLTTLKVIDAHRDPPNPIRSIDDIKDHYSQSPLIVNGNLCYLEADPDANLILTPWVMTDKCHGRLVKGGVIQDASNDDEALSPFAGPDAKYFAQDEEGYFADIGRTPGYHPSWPVLPINNPKAGIGGLSSNYLDSGRVNDAFQIIALAEIGEAGEGVVFTATQSHGGGGAAQIAERAERSGVKPLDNGVPKVLLLDGGTSVAVAHIDPDGDLNTHVKGLKYTPAVYAINTYVAFEATTPRNE